MNTPLSPINIITKVSDAALHDLPEASLAICAPQSKKNSLWWTLKHHPDTVTSVIQVLKSTYINRVNQYRSNSSWKRSGEIATRSGRGRNYRTRNLWRSWSGCWSWTCKRCGLSSTTWSSGNITALRWYNCGRRSSVHALSFNTFKEVIFCYDKWGKQEGEWMIQEWLRVFRKHGLYRE